jgi:hypothetical protein
MSNQPDINPYELEYARRHLAYLRRVADPTNQSILYMIMSIVFILGLVIYVAGDQITTGVIPLPAGWRADFVGDFLYNVGLVLWTSVVVVFLLEVAVDLQKRTNARYLKKLEQALGVRETALEPATVDSLAAQLAAMQADLAAVKAAVSRDAR